MSAQGGQPWLGFLLNPPGHFSRIGILAASDELEALLCPTLDGIDQPLRSLLVWSGDLCLDSLPKGVRGNPSYTRVV